MRRRALLVAFGGLSLPGFARAQSRGTPVTPDIVRDLAPTGRLRAAINLGNPVLVQGGPGPAQVRGASVDIARELGRRLGVPVELVVYETAGKVIPGQTADRWDIAFLAAEPERAAEVDFTAPYVFIEGSYLVAQASPFRAVADLDRAGVRIAVGKGAAYDLALTRLLKRAALVRAPTSQAAIDLFLAGGLDAAGGVRQALDETARTHAGYRVLPDSFTRIEQAMVTPKGRDPGRAYLAGFLADLKASGFIRRALDQSGQGGAVVAPGL